MVKFDPTVWERIVEKSPTAIYITDRYGKIVYVNDIVTKATKHSKEELYNLSSVLNLHILRTERVKKVHEDALRGKSIQYESRYIRKDGEVRWVWGIKAPIEIEGEIYILGNWVDITRLKELEEQLKVRNEYLGFSIGCSGTTLPTPLLSSGLC